MAQDKTERLTDGRNYTAVRRTKSITFTRDCIGCCFSLVTSAGAIGRGR